MKVLKSRYILVIVILSLLAVVSYLSFNLHQANQGDINHDGSVSNDDSTIMFANWSK